MTAKPPIACTLTPEELRARREGLLPGLAERAVSIAPVDGGVRLTFTPGPDVVATIARVVDAERQCCRFLRFAITIEPDPGPISLTITAPPEGQEILGGDRGEVAFQGSRVPGFLKETRRRRFLCAFEVANQAHCSADCAPCGNLKPWELGLCDEPI
jgi:hypothetical protein